MDHKRYAVFTYHKGTPCAESTTDPEHAGLFNMIDCGCIVEVEVGETDSLQAAKMMAGKASRRAHPEAVGAAYVTDESGETVWSR